MNFHNEINNDTTVLNAVPGASSVAAVKYFGRLSSLNHVSAISVCQTRPMITTKPVNVQITIVSKNTPIDCTHPCVQGCAESAAAAAMVIVP